MAVYSNDALVGKANRAEQDEPMFVISVAARLVEMHPQTLRYYERAGLLKPTRSQGRIRLYSQRDIERLRKIARLVEDLGVNLAGVEVILNLTERLELFQRWMEQNNLPIPEMLADGGDVSVLVAESTGDGREEKPARVRIQVRRPRAARKTQSHKE